MNPQFFISKIIFNDSTELLCDKNDIIVFVGANNVGKSLSLKEISSKFRSKGRISVLRSVAYCLCYTTPSITFSENPQV
jgi:ABC-type polysaccharide/polyol phosphate transport system ATPase subunit